MTALRTVDYVHRSREYRIAEPYRSDVCDRAIRRYSSVFLAPGYGNFHPACAIRYVLLVPLPDRHPDPAAWWQAGSTR